MVAILAGLAELAKIGAAGAILYGLFVAGKLLIARAGESGRPVPVGISIAHDDKGLMIYAVLVLASGALLAAIEFLPPRKPDLTAEITQMNRIADDLKTAKDPTLIGTYNACLPSPRWPEAAKGFESLGVHLKNSLQSLEQLDRLLRAKSSLPAAP